MKKIKLVLLLSTLLFSCNYSYEEKGNPKGRSYWQVIKIEIHETDPKLEYYKVKSIDTSSLNTVQLTWLVDSANTFHVGDTVWFAKK